MCIRDRIHTIIGGDADILFGGEPVIISEMQETVDKEIPLYAAIAVIMILSLIHILKKRCYSLKLTFDNMLINSCRNNRKG